MKKGRSRRGWSEDGADRGGANGGREEWGEGRSVGGRTSE